MSALLSMVSESHAYARSRRSKPGSLWIVQFPYMKSEIGCSKGYLWGIRCIKYRSWACNCFVPQFGVDHMEVFSIWEWDFAVLVIIAQIPDKHEWRGGCMLPHSLRGYSHCGWESWKLRAQAFVAVEMWKLLTHISVDQETEGTSCPVAIFLFLFLFNPELQPTEFLTPIH